MDELEKIVKYDNLKEIYVYILSIYDKSTLDHCIKVAIEVAKLNLDEISVYAALLHEATDYNDNKEIRDIIDGVKKISYLNYQNKDKLDSVVLRNMFLAIAKDIRVIIIKLCDRLCVMRNSCDILKAKETMEIYAPIAHRLGVSNIKSELEDICFRILYYNEYSYIKKKIEATKEVRDKYVKDKIEEIKKRLISENIEFDIYGRPKHFYSIYRKMKEKSCDIDDIFDLLAIRIITTSVKDCYIVLGIIHEMYKPMPNRFKDYIAVPKTNNYQSLHTTVFGSNGLTFEIQIRTWDMHNHAEYGIAAHFMYKEKSNNLKINEKKLLWVRQALELQDIITDTTNLKQDLFSDEVFVFTPKGDIKALVTGSTIIDFAYSIHQNIAEKMIGGKVNGKIVPINTKLNNTDICEIITSKSSSGPSIDWLKMVKSNSAKSKISNYLKKQGSDINIQRGKDIFLNAIKNQKIKKEELLKIEYINELIKTFNYKNVDSIYENIGFGTISVVKVINKLNEIYNNINNIINIKKVNIKVSNKVTDNIIVDGIDNCKVIIAKCCNPIPGDDIGGYITNGRGVVIHLNDCKCFKNLDNAKKIAVKFKDKTTTNYLVKLIINSNDREGLIVDILTVLKTLKCEVTNILSSKNINKEISTRISISIQNSDELNKIIREIKKIDSVYEVKRTKS